MLLAHDIARRFAKIAMYSNLRITDITFCLHIVEAASI